MLSESLAAAVAAAVYIFKTNTNVYAVIIFGEKNWMKFL